jgi:hypothetical protein
MSLGAGGLAGGMKMVTSTSGISSTARSNATTGVETTSANSIQRPGGWSRMPYLEGRWSPDMSMIHRLVGYDLQTDKRKVYFDIPDHLLGDVKKIAQVPDDDPDAVWSYAVSDSQVRRLAELINAEIDPTIGEFFLEAFADPPIVGRAKRRAKSVSGE